MGIETLIVDLSKDPFSPEKNFAAALEYESLNQTASAVSFYLRAIEYGYKSNKLITYTSLLKVARCFHDQNDRIHSVSNCLLQAVAYYPERPEAYFLLAQFYERNSQWQECYTWAEIGLTRTAIDSLPSDVGYHGSYCLEFEKAVSAWWIGRKDESQEIFTDLSKRNLEPDYVESIKNNLSLIGDLNANV